MRRFFLVLFVIAIMSAGALVAAALLVPGETYKTEIEQLAWKQTGRELRIAGDVNLTFWPRLGVEATDIRLSNADWGSQPSIMSMKKLGAALRVFPLLSGKVVLDSFVWVEPVIYLEVNENGAQNWVLTPDRSGADKDDKADGNGTVEGSRDTREQDSVDGLPAGGRAINDIQLGDIRIIQGSVSYKNAKTGLLFDVSSINASLFLPGLRQPLVLEGDGVWRGDRVSVALRIERPLVFLEAGETAFDVQLASPEIRASVVGVLSPVHSPRLAGTVTLDVPSMRTLAAWHDLSLPAGTGFGALSLRTSLSATPEVFVLEEIDIAADGMRGNGKLQVRVNGPRPGLEGQLAFDRIDANPYLGASAGSGSPGGAGKSERSDATDTSGWSQTPIDLGILRTVDLDLLLSAGSLAFQNIKTGPGTLKLKLDEGVLAADLDKLTLYEGEGSGRILVDASRPVPVIEAGFRVRDIAAYPLLNDGLAFKWLEGKGALTVSVSTRGNTQQQMLSALQGQAGLALRDGAIRGIDVVRLLRTVFTGSLTGWFSGGVDSTGFSELESTFKIVDGIATNQDLQLAGPLVRVRGAGTVNIPQKTLNYRVKPKLVATLEGQGTEEASGVEVPVIISGPWDNPVFMPDLKSVIMDPDGLVNTLKGGGAKKLLQEFIGGTRPGEEKDSGTQDIDPREVLKGFFGR